MSLTCRIQSTKINERVVELFVPEDVVNIPSQHSPYWGKLWPAAVGLSYFLAANKRYITNKNILELAAGLGLPSIYAASFATQVMVSDIEPGAVELIKKSAEHNQLKNLSVAVIDWSNVKKISIPDVLLLSDINYEPSAFERLEKTIHHFLDKNTIVILSTPQRLMAKPFIEKLLPYCQRQQEIMIDLEETQAFISVFVLAKQKSEVII